MFSNKLQILTIGFLIFMNVCFAQDTIYGMHKNLHIPIGKHIVKNVLTVTDTLLIDPGASLSLIENARIVCEGEVIIAGKSTSKIAFEGDKITNGVGLVFKGVSKNAINLQYVEFKNLELPLSFEFGWFKPTVVVKNCDFIGNKGKNYLIQMLNPPFFKDFDNTEIKINIENNVFADNNSGIYIEDFVNDFYNAKVENNLFIGNIVYGNSYNITTNFIYGRKDIQYKKFNFVIAHNVFADNYLMDVYEDTVIQKANLGIYGSSDKLVISDNYWDKLKLEDIKKTIYDHEFNFNSPAVDVQPVVILPNEKMPTFIYKAIANDTITVNAESKLPLSIKKFELFSNRAINLNNAALHFIHFANDSTWMERDTTILFDVRQNNNTVNITIQKDAPKGHGYYVITGINDINNRVIPNVKLGWKEFLLEKLKRKQIIAAKEQAQQRDSVQMQQNNKVEYQKIEIVKDKTKFEFSLLTGFAIFNGTISDKNNIFNNDLNTYLGANFGYRLNSILSLETSFSVFSLSNKDARSKNNEQLARGMEFKTSLYSLSQGVNLYFSRYDVKKLSNALNVGYEVMYFNPTGVYNGVTYHLQKLGTGGQFSSDQNKPYSLLTSGYFLGIVSDYKINKKFKIGLKIAYHRPFSNYIDDVGADKYPSATQILQSSIENKDAAIYFSNPTSRNTNGQYRNSPNSANDPFWIINLKFAIKF